MRSRLRSSSLAGAQVGVWGALRCNCSIYGARSHQSETGFRHVFCPLRLTNCSYSTPFTNSRGNPLAGPTGNHERPPAANKTTRTATPKHRMVVGRTYHLGVSICCLPSDFSHRGNQIGSRKIVSRPTKPVIICWWRRANIAPPAPPGCNSKFAQCASAVLGRDPARQWSRLAAHQGYNSPRLCRLARSVFETDSD